MNNMKIANAVLTTALMMLCIAASAQKYKTAADTVKLNKEYADVQKDLSTLKDKLDKANGKTSDYQAKVASTSQDATSAAGASKSQAATATNGNMSDIRKEAKMAKKAKNDADDQKDAQNNVKSNQKEIKKLNGEIDKKQKRLSELDTMRASISSIPAATSDSTGTNPRQ